MKKYISFLAAGLFSAGAWALDPSQYESELLYRTAHGSASDVALLLDGVDKPDLQNELGQPLLTIAAARTDSAAFAIVKKLIHLGANVNYGGNGRHYPLHAAIEAGNSDIVALLLKHQADYRLRNADGISGADLAEQSLSADVSQALHERLIADQQEYALLTSPAGRKKLRYDVSYHACALQYFTFYYRSKQDNIPKAEQRATLIPHQRAVKKAMGRLNQFFGYDTFMQETQFQAGKAMIYNQLEELISNRWRRKNGVGQPGDMEKRCKPIAEELSVKQLKSKHKRQKY